MANIIKFEIFKQKLISKENVYEICFEVIENPKFHYCWMGYSEEFDEYWFGLTTDENNAYDYKTVDELLNAKVFDGKSMQQLWDDILFVELNGLPTEDWIECYCKDLYI